MCIRVCRDGRLMGVLEVSRSIGDGAFKVHGVSSTPDVKKCQLTDDDRSVCLSSSSASQCRVWVLGPSGLQG